MSENKLVNFLRCSWQEGTQIGREIILTTVIFGGGAHFIFYFVYKYYFGLWESFSLRMVAASLCFSLVLYDYVSEKIRQNLFPLYWHFTVIIALPFIFTFNLLANNFNEIWLYWEIFGVILLAVCVPNWFFYLIDLFLGILLAVIFCLVVKDFPVLGSEFNVLAYLICIVFSGFVGLCFTYGSRSVWLSKTYRDSIAITGSLVHEMRNPINIINISSSTISNFFDDEKKITKVELAELSELVKSIKCAVDQANNIINITLSDLKNKPITDADFSYFYVSQILPKVINSYVYENESDKKRVHLKCAIKREDEDLVIKVVAERFNLIICNLLKNAAYYLKDFSDASITVGIEQRKISDKLYNVIYVLDTGPGISKSGLDKLFVNFYTSGKKEGTGLGLAFCKRNMKAFGGDIICESELGKWTKFSLLFPQLASSELEKAKSILALDKPQTALSDDVKKLVQLRGKNILIADDQELNLKIMEKRLRLSGVDTMAVNDGNKLVEAYKLSLDSNGKSHFDLIITDLNMPNKSGDAAIGEIREIEKSNKLVGKAVIPIIIISGDDNKEELDQMSHLNIAGYFVKGDGLDRFLELVVSSFSSERHDSR